MGACYQRNRDTAEKKTEKNLKKTESICENRCFSRVWKIHFEGIEMFSWNISLNIRKQTIYRLRHFERGIIFPKKHRGLLAFDTSAPEAMTIEAQVIGLISKFRGVSTED